MQYIEEKTRKTKVISEPEVLVVGGGIAGPCAAISAARLGRKVMLVERYGYLGGLTAAWPVPMLFQYGSEKEKLIRGIGWEIVERCKKLGPWTPDNGWHNGVLDTEIMKLVIADMLVEVGVEILLHSWVVDVIREDNRINGVIVENKSARQAILAKQTIDATGDADLVAFADGAFKTPADRDDERPTDNTRSHVSFGVHFGDIDRIEYERFKRHNPEGFEKVLAGLKAVGGVEDHGIREFASGCFHLQGDPCDAQDMSRLEVESSVKSLRSLEYLRENMPGYKDARIKRIAPQIGVRESRRIVGLHTLSKAECEEGVEHPDVVCRFFCGNPRPVGVPLRSMVPKELDGLTIGSRSIDVERKVFGAIRLIGTAFGLGHGAGAAAALCVEKDCEPRDLDAESLREALLSQNAYLDNEALAVSASRVVSED
jgi:ribulose 1,5-bisphosphate synthetase/thiazole synthase